MANVNSIFQLGGRMNDTSGVPRIIIPMSDYGKLLTLTGRCDSANYHPLYAQSSKSASGIYRVPAGKTFVCVGFTVNFDAAGTGRWRFGYGTSTFTDPVVSPPTGNVILGTTGNPFLANISADSPYFVSFVFSFPALSFPYVIHDRGAGLTRFELIGIEL